MPQSGNFTVWWLHSQARCCSRALRSASLQGGSRFGERKLVTVDIVVVDPEADHGHLRQPRTHNSARAMSRAASFSAVGARALAEARGQRPDEADAQGRSQAPKLVAVELSVAPWADGSMRLVTCSALQSDML